MTKLLNAAGRGGRGPAEVSYDSKINGFIRFKYRY